MMQSMKTTLGAAAIALLPVMGSAATTVTTGGTYDVLADAYRFEAGHQVGDAGGEYTFTFYNSSSTAAALTLFGGTVKQVTAAFDDGVSIMFGDKFTRDYAEGETDFFRTTFTLAAGETQVLTIMFGDTVSVGRFGNGDANIDFSLAATTVPVPAAGLLLLTALGGAAALRRRKSVDA